MAQLISVSKTLLQVFAFGFAGVSVLMAAALSVGLVLNWTSPSIDFGIATLCGLVAVMAVTTFYIYMLQTVWLMKIDPNESEYDDQSEMFSEEQIESIADQLTEAVMMRMVVHDGWSRTKAKSRR